MGGPGAPIFRAKPHGQIPTVATDAAKKRSFRRAVHRAATSEDQCTWYRGKRMSLQQLGVRIDSARENNFQQPSKHSKPQALHPRLRMVTWNCGWLHDTKYSEIMRWLCDEHEQGRPVHIMVLQETAWKFDTEYVTSALCPQGPQWYAVHNSSGSSEGGILVLILSTLVKSDQIRTAPIDPGRLFHVRLMMDPPLDLLSIYQHSWNVQKKTDPAADTTQAHTNKTEQLLQRRRKIWNRLGCIVMGDYNTPVQPLQPLVGNGIAKPDSQITQTDAGHQTHSGCMLNTWAKAGPTARTFIPAGPAGKDHGAQIDFIMTRGRMAGGVAKQAQAFPAPFVPHTGCRHLPAECYVIKPMRPSTRHLPRRLQPHEVRCNLQHEQTAKAFETHMDKVLREMDPLADSLDHQLLAGWKHSTNVAQLKSAQRNASQLALQEEEHKKQIHTMWELRHSLRSAPSLAQWQPIGPMMHVFKGWKLAAHLQAVTRQVRKAGRERKVRKVKDVLDSSNIFKTAKRLALKTPKRRTQLRDAQGKIQTHEQVRRQIVDFFRKLYDGPQTTQQPLTRPTKQGVLQGSGLSPLLWALCSGFLLKDMHGSVVDVGKSHTTYATFTLLGQSTASLTLTRHIALLATFSSPYTPESR